jgi:hypothetical protein
MFWQNNPCYSCSGLLPFVCSNRPACEKLLRIINRTVSKHSSNAKVQILALTVS